ncbi:phosphoglycerate mutase [Scheffersomyces xylosifermentans]|uniref:phosphoglycerate mutase n=1 Tax=Scheffersomyces xylosifermentans TaxID=1304137 RepID=UPI00315D3DB8
MTAGKKPTPRIIFVRHGQTEWSKSGQHTSVTDIDLTDFGVKQMRNTGKSLIGNSSFQMIKPQNITHIFVSPRKRAQHTVQLLTEGLDDIQKARIPIIVDEDIREWEYGDYEGLLTQEIIDLRKKKGLDKDVDRWIIWRDGCENGEVHTQVKERLDRFISKIKVIHKEALAKNEPSDIIVVAHGHILRCFAARWVQREINIDPSFMLDAGGVGVLSYQHHNVNEPALFLAGAFVCPVEEEGADL